MILRNAGLDDEGCSEQCGSESAVRIDFSACSHGDNGGQRDRSPCLFCKFPAPPRGCKSAADILQCILWLTWLWGGSWVAGS